MCSCAKKSKRQILLFKVDFDKAFDSINWKYIDSMLDQMGFGAKWRSWIQSCLSSSKASVLINGSPTEEFNITKGVRQGHPLSPFLFIIAMEGLNVVLSNINSEHSDRYCVLRGEAFKGHYGLKSDFIAMFLIFF